MSQKIVSAQIPESEVAIWKESSYSESYPWLHFTPLLEYPSPWCFSGMLWFLGLFVETAKLVFLGLEKLHILRGDRLWDNMFKLFIPERSVGLDKYNNETLNKRLIMVKLIVSNYLQKQKFFRGTHFTTFITFDLGGCPSLKSVEKPQFYQWFYVSFELCRIQWMLLKSKKALDSLVTGKKYLQCAHTNDRNNWRQVIGSIWLMWSENHWGKKMDSCPLDIFMFQKLCETLFNSMNSNYEPYLFLTK